MGLTDNRFHDYSLETGAYINQKTIRLEAGLSNLYVWVVPFALMPNWMKLKKDMNEEYNQIIKQRMDERYDISQIEEWDQRRIQKEVVGLQTEVRQGLDSGKYKTH